MSATTSVSGSTVPANFTASGSGPALLSLFPPGGTFPVLDGSSTVTGSVYLGQGNTSYTLSASAVDDTSAGGNSITTLDPSTVFAAPDDTISSAAATTIFGASTGTTTFSLSGADSSITGGTGYTSGSASGANTTLVGGTGGAAFTVSGAGSEAVAGNAGTTSVLINGSNEQVGTSPLPAPNLGILAATLAGGTTAETVVGGTGQASISAAGSTNDVFAFMAGHGGGSETISGFNSTDTFAFGGYNYSLTNPPAESITGSAGNYTDTITLSDNTTITLVGLTSNKDIF